MKMNLNIKLGEPMKGPSPLGPEDPYYPSITFHEDEPLDLPKEGLMVIRYKKARGTEEKDGSYSCTVEVQEIVSVEAKKTEAPSKRDKSAEEALDAHMAAREKESY
jgi:hypothetical protein